MLNTCPVGGLTAIFSMVLDSSKFHNDFLDKCKPAKLDNAHYLAKWCDLVEKHSFDQARGLRIRHMLNYAYNKVLNIPGTEYNRFIHVVEPIQSTVLKKMFHMPWTDTQIFFICHSVISTYNYVFFFVNSLFLCCNVFVFILTFLF